jgi:polyphosphate kinase
MDKAHDRDGKFESPDFFINRELSWLEFNQRVLEEAQDPSQPLLERLRFLCIVSNNLDEFFEVRVAGIKQQIENNLDEEPYDGMTPREVFRKIRERVGVMIHDQYQLWNNELRPKLATEGLVFEHIESLAPEQLSWAENYFHREVYPVLTPLAVDPSHPFPQLANKSHNIIVKLDRERSTGEVDSYAIVQIPRILTRIVPLPAKDGKIHFLYLSHIVRHFVQHLFPEERIIECRSFRITRNSDLYIDEEESANLLKHIEEELRKRNRGNAVRLELHEGCPTDLEQFLTETFKISSEDVYRHSDPINFTHLMPICNHEDFPHLRDRPWNPVTPPGLSPEHNLFDVIRAKDILLHHPYESFNVVVDFVERAAEDPQVLGIKMTLYRTSGDSPIVRALIRAASAGKQVAVLVELKARFDEENNILWARQMEEAGIHVVYGVVGLKTHCKMLMVIRRDEDRIRHYVHLGTGNYHPRTARVYTDLSYFTVRPEIGQEVANVFNILTGMGRFQGVSHLLVAPFDLNKAFLKLIHQERDHALQGRPARIIAKMNSLVEHQIIQALYEASCAGVKIDLIIRGICCLRPGISGVSENIRVISIVGRFLEHSRIYYFENSGDPKVYLGSADWMARNLFKRVEVVFPIENPELKKRIVEEILDTLMKDCVKSRELQSSGLYIRLKPAEGAQPFQAQYTFREIARKEAKHPDRESKPLEIIPLRKFPG